MSQDLLKLENEFRNELPRYREKPKIVRITQPSKLKDNIANFLKVAKEGEDNKKSTIDDDCDVVRKDTQVHMDIIMVEEQDSD